MISTLFKKSQSRPKTDDRDVRTARQVDAHMRTNGATRADVLRYAELVKESIENLESCEHLYSQDEAVNA